MTLYEDIVNITKLESSLKCYQQNKAISCIEEYFQEIGQEIDRIEVVNGSTYFKIYIYVSKNYIIVCFLNYTITNEIYLEKNKFWVKQEIDKFGKIDAWDELIFDKFIKKHIDPFEHTWSLNLMEYNPSRVIQIGDDNNIKNIISRLIKSKKITYL